MKRVRAWLVVALGCVTAAVLAACGCNGNGNGYSCSGYFYYGPGPSPSSTDGVAPNGLVQGTDGNFYGTTATGGLYGKGTFFRVTAAGAETVLYSFAGGATDGAGPEGVIQASNGTFYGATNYGGNGPCSSGCGLVYSITPAGAETVLYAFQGGADGADPNGVVQATDGSFYGTAAYGGIFNGACGTSGCGVVFRMTAAGGTSVVYSFTGGANGLQPVSLIQGSDGNFYGTTVYGGSANFGTAFRVTPAGAQSVLHSFTGGSDGQLPQQTQLLEGSDGNFYGTTPYGGASSAGVVYRITPAGAETVLHAFAGGSGDGAVPFTGVLQGTDGNYYGTTHAGGNGACSAGCGTVFQVTPGGTESLLYAFPATANFSGQAPYPSSLVQAGGSNFFGTTTNGGQYGVGTVFSLTSTGAATLLYSFGTNP